MKIKISRDGIKSEYNVTEGVDLIVTTESKHTLDLSVRENGVRLIVDGKEQKISCLDWTGYGWWGKGKIE